MNNPCDMETVSGRVINLADPDPSQIDINDIAWSLSRLVRYTGHTIQEIPYTVGHHSLFVAQRVEEQLELKYPFKDSDSVKIKNHIILHALLHDAGEAYTGDLSGPLKKHTELRPVIKKIEKVIDEAIHKGLGLEPEESLPVNLFAEIKKADLYCQQIEAYNFMCSRGLGWSFDTKPTLLEYQKFEMPRSNVEIYQEFLSRYKSLKKSLS